MTNLIIEARELYTGWMAYESMCHGGGQGAKSDDGEASRKFMLWLADEFPALCDALEKAQEQNKQLMHEVCKLACESVERDMALAMMEAEVVSACNSVRWIPVTERLPAVGKCVLIRQTYHAFLGEHGEYEGVTVGYLHQPTDGRCKPYFYYAAVSDYGDMVRAQSICPGSEFVTHWMPLPAAPEKGE